MVNLINASVSLKNKTKFEDILLMIGTNDPDFLRKIDTSGIVSVPEIGIGFGYSDPTMKPATSNLPSTWAIGADLDLLGNRTYVDACSFDKGMCSIFDSIPADIYANETAMLRNKCC